MSVIKHSVRLTLLRIWLKLSKIRICVISVSRGGRVCKLECTSLQSSSHSLRLHTKYISENIDNALNALNVHVCIQEVRHHPAWRRQAAGSEKWDYKLSSLDISSNTGGLAFQMLLSSQHFMGRRVCRHDQSQSTDVTSAIIMSTTQLPCSYQKVASSGNTEMTRGRWFCRLLMR